MTTARIPHLSRSAELLIHLLGWIFLIGFPHMLFRGNDEGTSIHTLRFIGPPLTMALVFYVNYFALVPRLLLKHHLKRYIISNIVLILVAFSLMQLWFAMMEHFIPTPESLPEALPKRPFPERKGPWVFLLIRLRDVVIFLFMAGLAALLRISSQWHRTELSLQRAELKKTEAELQSLRHQISPHFLLNTLNNIYALIAFDADKAQQAVQDLSKLLRHLLYDNREMFTDLMQEIDFLQNYIALMRIRLSDHVTVHFRADIPAESGARIAPLLFLPLVENAFKHGVSPTQPSRIDIYIHTDDDCRHVVCEVCNTNFPKTHADRSGSGVGLDQVQRRLELIYPGRYTWTKGPDAHGITYRSILTLEI